MQSLTGGEAIAMTQLAHSQFKQISEIASELWGLHLTEKKKQLVSNRLGRFLRKSRFQNVAEYLDHLQTDADEEDKLVFFDLLSTNVTSFFREREVFNYLEREFYTPLDRGAITLPGRKIRIWSAACSTGAEPYSIAIHAYEHLSDLSSWDFKILATDLAASALQTAREAVYPHNMVEQLDKALVRRHFTREGREKDSPVRIAPHIRELVTIGRVNLMDTWPMKGPFDVVFLRNAMIYFEKHTRQRLIERMYDLLRLGGILIIGSSETLSGCKSSFRTAQPSVYVK